MDTGMSQSRVLGGDLAFLPGGKNLPKKSVACPATSRSTLCQKCLCPRGAAEGRASWLGRGGAVAFPTFTISFGLFFFFLTLKISSFASDPPRQLYRISYLSTRKVVSVENLTGLFPSTWVTLVTCGDTGHSQPGIAAASCQGPASHGGSTQPVPSGYSPREGSLFSVRARTVTGRH